MRNVTEVTVPLIRTLPQPATGAVPQVVPPFAVVAPAVVVEINEKLALPFSSVNVGDVVGPVALVMT